MNQKQLYAGILGIQNPWRVADVLVDFESSIVFVDLAMRSNARLCCPKCGTVSPRYDKKSKTWRHLDTCDLRTSIRADVPRVECVEHGVRMIDVPWSEARSRYTGLFEAFVIVWLKDVPISAVSKHKQVIETLEKSDEVYTIASKPEAAPSFWERFFGSRDNRHGQYDPATLTKYITPGVQAEVLDLDAPGFFRPKRTISHTGVPFHEAGHAFIHDQLGIGDGSDGGPRQSERETHRIFDNPYNGFRRSGSWKFVFP